MTQVKRAVVAFAILMAILFIARGMQIAGRMATPGERLTYVFLGWDDTTEEAARFSERGFAEIRHGDSRGRVATLLGAPLDSIEEDRGTLLRFSRGNPEKSYWFRGVLVDSSGRVVARESAYVFD